MESSLEKYWNKCISVAGDMFKSGEGVHLLWLTVSGYNVFDCALIYYNLLLCSTRTNYSPEYTRTITVMLWTNTKIWRRHTCALHNNRNYIGYKFSLCLKIVDIWMFTMYVTTNVSCILWTNRWFWQYLQYLDTAGVCLWKLSMEVAVTHTPTAARHRFNVMSDVCDQSWLTQWA